jgi:hypothetical protein
LPQAGYEVFNPESVEYQIIGWEDIDWTDLAQDKDMDWTQLAQDKDKWRDLVNMVMTFQSYAIR